MSLSMIRANYFNAYTSFLHKFMYVCGYDKTADKELFILPGKRKRKKKATNHLYGSSYNDNTGKKRYLAASWALLVLCNADSEHEVQ